VKDFPKANVGSFSDTAGVTGLVGHYTQLVWAKTKKVGCGFVMFVDKTNPTTPYKQVHMLFKFYVTYPVLYISVSSCEPCR
jgi:hypothetical protein